MLSLDLYHLAHIFFPFVPHSFNFSRISVRKEWKSINCTCMCVDSQHTILFPTNNINVATFYAKKYEFEKLLSAHQKTFFRCFLKIAESHAPS